MKKLYQVRTIACCFFLFTFAQQVYSQQGTIILPASTHYHKGSLYRTFWGNHYRPVWHTPVRVPVVSLDTLMGGLVPYELGGSRQTKSLKLRDGQNREYVLRSVDKTFGGALPENLRGTFIESMANDQVTISNPYGALVVAPLAEAVGILHTNPQLVYVPKQAALSEYSEKAGDILYMLEQRPDENWETAANFANSKKIVGTDKMLEKLLKDNDNSVDEQLFVRSRLFDFYIGDWGRHEDQWRWAETEDGKQTIYKPVPRDRDNAFTRFDGKLLVVKPSHLQSFEDDLKKIKEFGFTARGLDRRLTASLTLEDWTAIARDMQSRLTDEVITNAVRSMPPEVLPLLEKEYIEKLKARRSHIVEWATVYYQFINRHGVDVLGSEKKELFVVNRLSDEQTEVTVYKFKDGDTGRMLYKRTFNAAETKELRLFAMGDNDRFELNGATGKGMKVIIIGTKDKERVVNNIASGRKTTMRDGRGDHNIDGNTKNIQLKFHDRPRQQYVYKYFRYNKACLMPIVFYNWEDRIHVGLGYSITRQKWNKDPFWVKHRFAAKYSIDQKAFSFSYDVTLTKLVANWNVNLSTMYDDMRWLNFFGIGNETKLTTLDRDFFRFRYRTIYIEPSVERLVHHRQRIKIAPFFERVIPVTDTARFVVKKGYNSNNSLDDKSFAGIYAEYVYQNINDSTLPTRGFGMRLASAYTHPVTDKSREGFVRLAADMHGYLPLSKKFGIAVHAGAATLAGGTPEFYQYNRTGGTRSIRGFQRERFYGTTSIYDQNELRWITNVRSYLFNGKIGLFALYDIGRVYEKNEHSDSWHAGYGGGLILSPFNFVTVNVSYAKSAEDKNLHIGFVKNF